MNGNVKTKTIVSTVSFKFNEIKQISVQMGTIRFYTGEIGVRSGGVLVGLSDPNRF